MKKALLTISFFCTLLASAQQQFTVYFNFDVEETSTASGIKLNDWINNNKNAFVLKIDGYADKTGDSLYNIDLSERRASFTYKKLQDAGINVASALQNAFGESMSTSAHNAKDRKVIVTYKLREPFITPEKPKPSEFAQKVINAEKGDKIKVPNLNFYNNSDIVLPDSRPVLRDLLGILRDNPKLQIEIQGHICCQAVEEHEISLRRAQAVYFFLIKNGIDKSRLTYKSFGSKFPIYKLPEKTEEERVANRRVEIEIIGK